MDIKHHCIHSFSVVFYGFISFSRLFLIITISMPETWAYISANRITRNVIICLLQFPNLSEKRISSAYKRYECWQNSFVSGPCWRMFVICSEVFAFTNNNTICRKLLHVSPTRTHITFHTWTDSMFISIRLRVRMKFSTIFRLAYYLAVADKRRTTRTKREWEREKDSLKWVDL